ncbi:MAG: ArsR/SmtB family transcription factor [Fidelibacterota bacterium]
MKLLEKKARICKILSVSTRLQILELLKERCFCVNALSHQLGITPAAVSQHLRILRDAGVVTAEKRGYHVHYSLEKTTLSEWYMLLKDLLE